MIEAKELHSTVICLHEGKMLFVRKESPEWSLPGGKIEPQESPVEAAHRELKEETSLSLENARYLGHYEIEHEAHHLYRMAVSSAGQPSAAGEIVECRWFTLPELESLQVKPTNRELLQRAGALNPAKATR